MAYKRGKIDFPRLKVANLRIGDNRRYSADEAPTTYIELPAFL
jgi:hypothetical protein